MPTYVVKSSGGIPTLRDLRVGVLGGHYSATGLPPGLSMDVNGLITGTPTSAGTFVVIVQKSGTFGTVTTSFTWTITPTDEYIVNFTTTSGLTWVEIDHVDLSGNPKTYVWSEVDLVDPIDYYAGFKEGRVLRFGDVIRGLSDSQGQYESTEFGFTVSSADRLLHTLLGSRTTKFFENRMVTIRMISDEARRALETPRVLARGVIRKVKPRGQSVFEITARDFLASLIGLGTQAKLIPSRTLTAADFPNCPTQNLEVPVPIGYGELSDENLSSTVIPPIESEYFPVFDVGFAGEVIGGAGTTTYRYVLTGMPHTHNPFGYGIAPDPQNPADDSDHRLEVVIGAIEVINAPSPEEISSSGGARHVRLTWGNLGSGARTALWGIPGDANNGTSRIYGRDPTQTLGLLAGFGVQTGADVWIDDGRSPKFYSNPPIDNAVLSGEITTPGSIITRDLGRGMIPTIHVGQRTIGADAWEEFVVFGHAIKQVVGWYVGGTRQLEATEGVDFLIPGFAGYIAAIDSNMYRDFNGRRYSVIYAKGTKGQQAVDGSAPITLNVRGIEDVGDGTGTLISQIADIYLHFVTNFGFQDWTSGAWLSIPEWDAGQGPKIDATSFATLKAVHANRISGGYPGAIVFGSPIESALSVRDAIARLNLSSDCQSGFNRLSQFFVSIFDETADISASASYTQSHDIIEDQFSLDPEVDLVENEVSVLYARVYARAPTPTGEAGVEIPEQQEWLEETASDAQSIVDLRATKAGQKIELHGIRSRDAAVDILQRRLLMYSTPPIPVILSTDFRGLMTELGDVILVSHTEGTGASGWDSRPVRVLRQVVSPSSFLVRLEGIDVERLFDTAFILGDETILAPWVTAPSGDRRYGYLADEVTEEFSDGAPIKRLR